jgi:hypothetical protein
MWPRKKHPAPPPLTACPTYQRERRQARQEIEKAQDAAEDAVVESKRRKQQADPIFARLFATASENSFARGWLATIERRPR